VRRGRGGASPFKQDISAIGRFKTPSIRSKEGSAAMNGPPHPAVFMETDMTQFSRRTVLALAGLCLAGGAAFAVEDRGTKDEAKAMVDAAYDHIKKVGPEKAYADFTNDKANWTKKDLYVMVYDSKNVNLAHGANPKLVGKDMSAVKDAAGKPVVLALNALAAKGGGWYDYDWPDPITKKIMLKSTYARSAPGGDGFVGVGVFR
jgi:cytochrome c